MNIKKYTLRPMCTVLACSTFLSGLLAVHATDAIITESPIDESVNNESTWTMEENNFEEVEVTYKQSSSYFVTIPKTVALDAKKQAAYSVKVAGEIDMDQRVYVAPVDGISETENIDFYMKHQAADNTKADVVATVTQNKTYWDSGEVADGYEETDNHISALDLTSGTWKGTFQMEIRLEVNKDASHTHNYVDGVCTECGAKDPNAGHEHNYVDGICDDCGAVDPNHTHNYEDGTCTICGKETGLYDVAPESAYSNWNYTLDDENNIITLNYYVGAETDVIVYGNYEVNGNIYKTQIASNASDMDNALNTANAPYMFNGYVQKNCRNIGSIKFSDEIDTSNVTDMSRMFNQCESLVNLDISNFDTSNVKNMYGIFNNCSKLTSLDLSSFDTSNVMTMEYMFYECRALTNLDLNNFNTRNVTTMKNMFYKCIALTTIDLSSFDTSSVKSMESMFERCTNLESLDLSSFDTSTVTNMYSMFLLSSNLKTIYVTEEKWLTSQADTRNMFSSCGTSDVTFK